MNLLDWLLILSSAVAGVWWAIARHRRPAALDILSTVALVLALVTIAAHGGVWQLRPWQLVALIVATCAAVRRWRASSVHRWSRVLGRTVLVVAVLVGLIALLTVPVPTLAQPSGSYRVGSEIFHWTDTQRPETFTTGKNDSRQVSAQAWYPTDETNGKPVPYFEAQGRLPATVAGFPSWFFHEFDNVETHAMARVSVSTKRDAWPVLIFSPGLGLPREIYTTLSVELASRGYVVVALSHPHESSVAVLADGSVVGQTVDPPVTGPGHRRALTRVVDVRVADSSFVLDQLTNLQEVAPRSPLVGHLDLEGVGIVGHSLGGATALEALALDARFKVGVNLDGKLFGTAASSEPDQPVLWVQSDGTQDKEYKTGQDELFDGLRGGGELLTVVDSRHLSFSDAPAFFSSVGRGLLGSAAGFGSVTLDRMTVTTADLIAAFVGPPLSGSARPTLNQVLTRNSSVTEDRRVAAVTAP